MASIGWTRPFDVSADNSLTLEAGKNYKVFITWVTANKDGSKFQSEDDVRSYSVGTTKMEEVLTMPVLKGPDPPEI